MYALQVCHFNHFKNLFFEDVEEQLFWSTASEADKNAVSQLQIDMYHRHHMFYHGGSLSWNSSRIQLTNGTWKRISLTCSFTTAKAAENHFKDIVETVTPLRIARVQWHQENLIQTEANILKVETQELVKSLIDCQNHVCFRFGTCDKNPNACSISGKIIPVLSA